MSTDEALQWLVLTGSPEERFSQWQAQTGGFDVDKLLFTEAAGRQLPQSKSEHTSGWIKAQLRIAKNITSPATSDALRLAYAAWDAAATASARFRRDQASPLPLGCHSLAAMGVHTRSGEVLHGRSFDGVLLGGKEWRENIDRVQLVLHRQRRKKSYLAVHHLGAFLPGMSAVNEAGLSLTAHAVATRETSEYGCAALPIFERILQECSGLRGAEEVLRRQRYASGWLVVLAHAESKTISLMELDAKGATKVRRRGEFIAAAQGFRSEKQAKSFAPSDLLREREWSRIHLLNGIARRGDLDAQGLLQHLQDDKDAYDPSSRIPFGNTLQDYTHSDSVVFDVANDALWLRTGHHPRLNKTLRLNLSSLFNRNVVVNNQTTDDSSNSTLEARLLFDGLTTFKLPELRDSAKMLLSVHSKRSSMVSGVLTNLHFLDDEIDQALHFSEAALLNCSSPYREGALYLLRARSFDLLGKRSQARQAYADVLLAIDATHPSLFKRAKRGRRRAFSRRELPMLRFWAEVADVVN
ncbi:MAG: hypothetical protein GY822_24770 [Deltaproteobacteria bacterium]|nr:hypothetical protein [Deltaproteobacteria bacterium]